LTGRELSTAVTSRGRSTSLYRKYLESDNLRYVDPQTKYRYLRLVNIFLRYIHDDFGRESLLGFLRDREELSPSYRRWEYQVLKGFYKVCNLKWPLHPRDLPYKGEPERPYLETEEAEKFLELARGDPLDYAMFRLALITGIRKRELRELNLEDYSPPRITIYTRKHGEKRVRTLDVETVGAIASYVAGPRKHWSGRYRGRSGPLFLSPTGIRLPDSTLTKWFARYMRAIGKPKGCGMHSLRRTCVTWESNAGLDTIRLQKLHGWKSARMPEVYSRLKPEQIEREAYMGNPLISSKGAE